MNLPMIKLSGAAWLLVLLTVATSRAERVMTTPSTAFGDPPLSFDNIALTPDGTTIIATGLLNASLADDRIYSIPVPANAATDTVTATQLSSSSFLVNNYDVDGVAAISPDGQTILFTHNGNGPATNAIYTMPITGEGMSPFTGFFGGDPNLVSPGTANSFPTFSPNGATVFFLNSESAFGGAVPDFASLTAQAWALDGPDWDQLYAVPAGGGAPVAITQPGDGDIDGGLFAVTPDGQSVVFAPDNPIRTPSDRGDSRPKLFSVPATGGATTEIAFSKPSHQFTIGAKLDVTPDGQSILFIGDYETPGKNELYSLPIGGGTPTRVSADLPFAGDVTTFEISPDGASVAYIAGQNTSANFELFLAPIGGGSSARINVPAAVNSGFFDLSAGAQGQIQFSPDSSRVFYLGDLDIDTVEDIYVVDTSEKTGLIPSVFTFTGPSGGDFFEESNWQDAQGNSPAAGTIDPGVPIRHSLLIDGDTVRTTGNGGEADFQTGGSLELTPGSVLEMLGANDLLDFNPNAGLKLDNATIRVNQDVVLEGTNYLVGGSITSITDDIEFNDEHDSFVDGTAFSSGDNTYFDNSATSISGAVFESADRLGLRFNVDVTVTDTTIRIAPGGGAVEDIFQGNAEAFGVGSTLTLLGDSLLEADLVDDGIALVLGGTSLAELRGDTLGDDGRVILHDGSTVTVLSTGAALTLGPIDVDSRGLVINGLTGLSYLEDPTAWNISDWDGLRAIAMLSLVATTLDGDYNDDGVVDAIDYAIWRENLGSSVTLPGDTTPGTVTSADFDVWRDNFGATQTAFAAASTPEPTSLVLGGFVALVMIRRTRQRMRRTL